MVPTTTFDIDYQVTKRFIKPVCGSCGGGLQDVSTYNGTTAPEYGCPSCDSITTVDSRVETPPERLNRAQRRRMSAIQRSKRR